MMKSEIRALNEQEVHYVSGGHGSRSQWKPIAIGLFLLELPHIIMGLIEFTNFTIDLSQPHDHDHAPSGHGHGHGHNYVGEYIKDWLHHH